jgi:hypothetical protein
MTMSRSAAIILSLFWILPLAALAFTLQGCATPQTRPADPTAFKNRTKSSAKGNVTVTVAVPTADEAQALYGVNLRLKFIQPVWLAVVNDSTVPYWFLPSGLDPDHFSPSEAAFAFHSGSEDADRKLIEKFQRLQFKNPVRPGSSEAGFVLVNLDEGFKAVDIDLISRDDVQNFSFIIADPEFRADYKLVDFNSLHSADEIVTVEDEEELRRVLEELPCCTTNANGDENGDPLNLVIVGDTNDIVPALVRRGWHATEIIWSQALYSTFKSFLLGERYRYSPISSLYLYGRKQDVGWQKARRTINERNHMRFWLSPIRFRGQEVFVGQISRDIGVKFTLKSPTISTHVIDPDVDEARRYFVEDMAYSQALARHGYVKGVGPVTRGQPRMNLVGDPYYTDGLRVVLFLDSRPYTLSDIELLDWERPSGYYLEQE